MAFARWRVRTGAVADLPVLAVGVQGGGWRKRLHLLADYPALRPDFRIVHPVDRHRRRVVSEKVYSRRDFNPGTSRWRFAGDRPQDGGGEPDRRVRGLDDPTAQADRAVLRRGHGCVRARHLGRVCWWPHQEPLEAGCPHRRGQKGGALDVGLDPPLPGRDDLSGARHRHGGRTTVHQNAPGGWWNGDRFSLAGVRRRRHHRRITP
ncbi:Uncharacterised protein [Mycobacterium tuberculosis]|nr:Uncharacterised protein [Mycobacterium tuberculosis]